MGAEMQFLLMRTQIRLVLFESFDPCGGQNTQDCDPVSGTNRSYDMLDLCFKECSA